MLGASVTFTGMTTLVKFLGSDYSPTLQTFYRLTAALVILLPFMLRGGRRTFHTTRPLMLISRAVLGVAGVSLAFYAFQVMPLAQANALSFTRSLWVTLLAAVVMREHVGPMRTGAVVVGFLGVVVMLAQGLSAGQLALGLPAGAMLLSAFLLAFSVAGIKLLAPDHSPLSVMIWGVVLGWMFSIPGALLAWRWPAPSDFGLLCLMGVLSTINQAMFIRGMQAGDAAAMAPIDYTRLVFAAIVGLVMFDEVPDVWTVVGAAIIVGSTLFITIREIQAARRARQG